MKFCCEQLQACLHTFTVAVKFFTLFSMARTDKPSGSDMYFGIPEVMLIESFRHLQISSFKAFFPSVLHERIVVAICLGVDFEIV